MNEEITLARDLAVILISAGIFTIISKALKQPSVLGYIIAGFLIGPNIGFYFGITSTEAVNQWSEIGIIFLMFGLGLEFSFKKLVRVGGPALITTASKFLGVFILGFLTGMAMSWSTMESIFLGGLLSMSSTTVIIKSYDEMGLKNKPYAPIVFGTIIIEDMIAILLMVLLSSLAVSNKFAGGEMLFNLGKLAFFLILWFLVGIYLIPTLLKRFGKYINDEILLIVSIGLCLAMVAFAEGVGFSSALGAFVMGSILAETIESERIEKLVTPIKDLFGAVFFVSVGMMVSPAVIAEHWGTILIITILIFISDILFVTIGAIIAGKGLENAVHAGFSLAQLGEFGFIIAGVGCSLGVMREFIYPVIIAVSVITTFIAPYMIKLSDPAYRFLQKHLPEKLLNHIGQERKESSTVAEQSEWKLLLKTFLIRTIVYGVLILAVDLLTKNYLPDLLTRFFPDLTEKTVTAISMTVTLVAISPFIYGLGVSPSGSSHVIKLLKESDKNILPIFGIILARVFMAISAILGVIAARITLSGWAILAIVIGGFILIMSGRYFFRKYSRLEKQFFANLTSKENRTRKLAPVTTSFNERMKGYDVHIEAIMLPQNSEFTGHRLRSVPIRQESGASIIKIARGDRNIIIPSSDVRIYPFDRLLAVGTTEQLSRLKAIIEDSVPKIEDSNGKEEFTVDSFTLSDESYLTGKALKECSLADFQCMMISVMRDGEFIANPKADFRFRTGDTVWIAGNTSSCDWLK
ncbi:MAG: cation:proton antiporter [Candidatus Cryptobacteroides sp.]